MITARRWLDFIALSIVMLLAAAVEILILYLFIGAILKIIAALIAIAVWFVGIEVLKSSTDRLSKSGFPWRYKQ